MLAQEHSGCVLLRVISLMSKQCHSSRKTLATLPLLSPCASFPDFSLKATPVIPGWGPGDRKGTSCLQEDKSGSRQAVESRFNLKQRLKGHWELSHLVLTALRWWAGRMAGAEYAGAWGKGHPTPGQGLFIGEAIS